MQISSQYPPGTIRFVDIRDNGTIVLKTYDGERREYRAVVPVNQPYSPDSTVLIREQPGKQL